jgi:hypothetical protein
MKSGKCPKCGSTEIYCSDNVELHFKDSNIEFRPGRFSSSHIKLVYYACGACEHIEIYADKVYIDNIRKAWRPLNPRKSKRKNDET